MIERERDRDERRARATIRPIGDAVLRRGASSARRAGRWRARVRWRPSAAPRLRASSAARSRGRDVDDDRDHEQHDGERDQRRACEVVGLAPLVRDHGRHRVAGRERVRVIWPSEPITSAAAIVSPIARPRPSITAPTRPPLLCGQTAPRDHLPARRAERERGLLLARRRRLDHLARERRDDRRDHDREDDARGQERRAGRRPEERAEDRDAVDAEAIDLKCGASHGASTRMPHRPNTTDGTTASRSST